MVVLNSREDTNEIIHKLINFKVPWKYVIRKMSPRSLSKRLLLNMPKKLAMQEKEYK